MTPVRLNATRTLVMAVIASLGLISLLDPAPDRTQLVASAQDERDWISISDLPTIGVDGTVPTDRPVEWISIADLPLVPIDPKLVERAAAQTLTTHVEGARFAGPAVLGIPVPLLAAYNNAETTLATTDPSCHLPWWLLAGIGKIESNHARGGRVDATGRTNGEILGPRLDGSLPNTAVIGDSDGGRMDGDARYDRAVGPMQFLPSTWLVWGADGNQDGRRDPHNVFDAALAAGRYLCAGDTDLSKSGDLANAVLRYNPSAAYLRSVLGWAAAYRDGGISVPAQTGPVEQGSQPPTDGSLPPVAGLPPVLEELPDHPEQPPGPGPLPSPTSSPSPRPTGQPTTPPTTPPGDPDPTTPPTEDPTTPPGDPDPTPTEDPTTPPGDPDPTPTEDPTTTPDPTPTGPEPTPTDPEPTEPAGLW